MKRSRCFLVALLAVTASSTFNAAGQEPQLIRFGRGFAAEEQVWLMSARHDLTPNQGKKYQLKQILFQANPERFQAFLAGELDGGTAPGLAVIFARAQGVDMKIVASVCLEAAGEDHREARGRAPIELPGEKRLKALRVGLEQDLLELVFLALVRSQVVPRAHQPYLLLGGEAAPEAYQRRFLRRGIEGTQRGDREERNEKTA